MSEATATNHLSIGEVLSLVQEDFPDVTISKIRFLESQGLIAPERTGSGYRKFYGADIERLRWILRQQRDNFLPLKVIKKMLDDGVDLSGTMETQPTLWANTDDADASSSATDPDKAPGGPGSDDPDARRMGEGEPAVGRTTPPGDDADDVERAAYRSPSHPAVASAAPKSGSSRRRSGATGKRPAADTQHDRAADGPSGAAEGAGSAPSNTSASAAASDSTPRGGRPDHTGSAGGSAAGGDRPTDGPTTSRPGGSADSPTSGASEVSEPERPAHSTPADVVAALQEDPRSARKRRQKAASGSAESLAPGESGSDAAAEAAPAAAAAVTSSTAGPAASIAAGTARDALLSADELLETSGITAELLADLEQYGLVVAASLGGRSAYDSEAVDVARMAAKYAELGVEPRHLRMYKVSAEREAGFVEQLVVPLIKQRNPAARQLAVDRCDELIAMGAELHAALLRRQLRRIIGG